MYCSKLRKKSEVVFEQETHVAYAVLQHCDPFDPHAEGKTGVCFCVIGNVTEHFRVYHAGAQDLEPSRILADPAALPLAHNAGNVNFGARLSEREKARTQPDPRSLAEILVDEYGENALQIAERDALVHQ